MTSHRRHHSCYRRPATAGNVAVLAAEAVPVYDPGAVGPGVRDAVREAGRWLARVVDLTAQATHDGGELGALLDLLEVIDTAQAAAVALTDLSLADSLAERHTGLSFDSLLALRSKATYGERGRLQRLARLLRHTPHLKAAWQQGTLGTGQLLAIAAEAKVLTVTQLAELDRSFADRDRLDRLDPDQLVDLVRARIDRLRPELAEARETRHVERSFVHLQPHLDGSGEGHFGYGAEDFATIVAALDAASQPPTNPDQADDHHDGDHDHDGDGDDGGGRVAFGPGHDTPRARRHADALLAICEDHLATTSSPCTDTACCGDPCDADAATDRAGAAQHRGGVAGVGVADAVTSTCHPGAVRPPRHVRRRRGRPRVRATVVLDINDLTGDAPAARTARLLWALHGTPPALTAAGVRRLCSDARWQFLLTDGHTLLGISAPTDAIPRRLRDAVQARDQGCRFPGCRAPIDWCDLHHVIGREHGGPTLDTNLVALCRRHHTAVTTGRWTLTMTPTGTVTVKRGRTTRTTDPPLHTTLEPDRPPP
jgi:hypothetical protein